MSNLTLLDDDAVAKSLDITKSGSDDGPGSSLKVVISSSASSTNLTVVVSEVL